jgi:hypothetical protein
LGLTSCSTEAKYEFRSRKSQRSWLFESFILAILRRLGSPANHFDTKKNPPPIGTTGDDWGDNRYAGCPAACGGRLGYACPWQAVGHRVIENRDCLQYAPGSESGQIASRRVMLERTQRQMSGDNAIREKIRQIVSCFCVVGIRAVFICI